MALTGAFQPMGKTFAFEANSSSQTFEINADSPCNQYFVCNHDNSHSIFVRISTSANNVAVANSAGTYGFIVRHESDMVISGPQVSATGNVFVSVIAVSGNPKLYITPGEGMS